MNDDMLVFTASAEASQSTYEDGALLGSVVGTIDRGGEVRRLRTPDRKHKVEGVHGVLDSGVVTMTFVCDQDDSDIPSPCCRRRCPRLS